MQTTPTNHNRLNPILYQSLSRHKSINLSPLACFAATVTGGLTQIMKIVKDLESLKADRIIAVLAAITGTPLKPITV